MQNAKLQSKITGRAISLPDDNIDTDRIIPARFLKCVTFNELGAHVFEDDRAALKIAGKIHPFDDPKYHGSSVLFTGENFGSGSSREHAVHALIKWGIRAIISYRMYSEIFFSNATANGLPCVIVNPENWKILSRAITSDKGCKVSLDIEAMTVASGTRIISCSFQHKSTREVFLSGDWDNLGVLLDAKDETNKIIEKLQYYK